MVRMYLIDHKHDGAHLIANIEFQGADNPGDLQVVDFLDWESYNDLRDEDIETQVINDDSKPVWTVRKAIGDEIVDAEEGEVCEQLEGFNFYLNETEYHKELGHDEADTND